MSQSINFATHYRPTTYAEVVGQDIAKSVLKKIAQADGISARAVFLKGAWGSGKSTLCRIFARSMNCENFKKTGEVCNECAYCKEVSAENSQLYYEFDSSVVGSVDKIRELKERLSYTPNGRRVVVFDEIHAASRAAQNAMLKMVEEGIPNTIFVFASTDDILPTIKSRSICLDISTIPYNLIKQRLHEVAKSQNIDLSDTMAELIAVKSAGHMRDALSLLQLYSLAGEEGIKSSYHLVEKFFENLALKNKQGAISLISQIMMFNVVDIRNAIDQYIRNLYLFDIESPFHPESISYKLAQKGFANFLFGQIYTPISQSALTSESGTELLLRALVEKMCKQNG